VSELDPQVHTPEEIDRPACFYIGREYDLASKAAQADRPVLYDAKNLCTHGVIVGMTGSGKTGLSVTILEEAAIDGIPAVIIDPKGDLANLLLRFPDLAPDSFLRWLSPEDARQRNMTAQQYAESLAERWRKGLLDSGQTLGRFRELAQTDCRIYTPGSEAGLPISILRSFAAPTGLSLEDRTHKVNATVTALLGLGGISGDPVQSREHVLLAQIILDAWEKGRSLSLADLVHEIPNPAINMVGAYNLETFFPARDRVKFASQLNNLMASPMFAMWSRGEPLDLGAMMYRRGRPQHNIFYLAHLDDSQRMFFITLLLEEVLAWTRRQTGTSNLRAMVYFDEVFGYLPPHPGNPPSKGPLLTLLKQARAFGVGVLLATQNPVDLDYKALSNAGTWFVGKLQTERDKARLLDGLQSVASEHGTLTDRGYLEKVIASLGSRVFLLHDINAGKPRLFLTRHALSFLRGPMSREEVSRLTEKARASDAAEAAGVALCNHCHAEVPPGVGRKCPSCGKDPLSKPEVVSAPVAQLAQAAPAAAAAAVAVKASGKPPVLPADVTQVYIPVQGGARAGHRLVYHPWLLGCAEVVFHYDKRGGAEHRDTVRLLARPPAGAGATDWQGAFPLPMDPTQSPEPNARWEAVPGAMDTSRKLKALEKEFGEFVAGSRRLNLFESRGLEMISKPGEQREAFVARCRAEAERQRDEAIHLEELKFQPKIEAARGSTGKGAEDRVARLEADLESKKAELTEKFRRLGESVSEVQLKPRKSDVRVTQFALAWAPFWVKEGSS
jgi:hypothetical protein